MEHRDDGNANAARAPGGAPVLSEAEQRQIRILKGIVVGLGVLIILGLGALIAAVVLRASANTEAARPADAVLELPASGRVADMRLDGQVLVLLLEGAGGEQELVVLHLRRGEILRRIRPGGTPRVNAR